MLNEFGLKIFLNSYFRSLERNNEPSVTIDCGDQSVSRFVSDFFIRSIMPKTSEIYYDYDGDLSDSADLFSDAYTTFNDDYFNTDADYSVVQDVADFTSQVRRAKETDERSKNKKTSEEKLTATEDLTNPKKNATLSSSDPLK
jgi:hypothetical protein